MAFTDSSTDSVLGVRDLLDRLAPVSKAGVACAGEIRFFGAGDERAWRDEMERLVEAEQWCAGEPSAAEAAYEALAELPLIERPLRKARVVGVLGEAELFCVKRFLFYAYSLTEAAIDLLNGWGLAASCPTQIEALMEAIHPQKQPTPRFHLTSELSDELDELRIELRRKKKLERKLRDGLEKAVVADHGGTFDIHGTFRPAEDTAPRALERDDRLTHTHGGWKLADPPLRDYERDIAKIEEQLEELEHEIRARLSEKIAEQADWLEELADIFARLDMRLAKVRLRRALEGCWPQWCDHCDEDGCGEDGSDPGIAIEGGREPRVARLLDDRPGEDVQLVDIAVDDAPVVITGPNMGGKSVLLRLIGICQWCAQHALPAPAQSCTFSPVDAIIYVGSEEPSVRETTQGLSSFGREVRRLVEWWERDGGDASEKPRLWLLDELGRGTHPDEGAQIACEVIDRLAERGERVVVATHFPQVASLDGAKKLRIAGLTDPARLEALLADKDLDVEEALRRAMDFRPLAANTHDVPRDARVVARALGLDLHHSTETS